MVNKKSQPDIIFLTAGIGSRLIPLTNKRPKCLIKIGKFSTIENLINILTDIDFKSTLFIVVGYKSELIVNWILKINPKFNVEILHNNEYLSTNSLFSLSLTFDLLNNSILVMNGDLYLSKSLISSLLLETESSLLIDFKSEFIIGEMNVQSKDQETLSYISKQITHENYYAKSLQVYLISSEDLILFKIALLKLKKSDAQLFMNGFSSEILNFFVTSSRIRLIDINEITETGFVYEIDTLEDYYSAVNSLRKIKSE